MFFLSGNVEHKKMKCAPYMKPTNKSLRREWKMLRISYKEAEWSSEFFSDEMCLV